MLGLFAGLVLLFGGAAPALAAPSAIQITLTQQKVLTDKDGKVRLADAANVLPGDIVEYRAVYRNVSRGPVTGLAADLPIPNGLEYQQGSATPANGLTAAATSAPSAASFASLPLMKKLPDGRLLRLPLADYRVLRWSVARLPAGAQIVVSARARVISTASQTAGARP